MAKTQQNGPTILLGLEDYKVGEVTGGKERVVVRAAAKGKDRQCYPGGHTNLLMNTPL